MEEDTGIFKMLTGKPTEKIPVFQMIENQARDLDIQGSNPGPDSNFSLKIWYCTQYQIYFIGIK